MQVRLIYFMQFGITPLHQASLNGHKEIVELLLTLGASVDLLDTVTLQANLLPKPTEKGWVCGTMGPHRITFH